MAMEIMRRLSFYKEIIWGGWWQRVVLTIYAAVAAYDTIQGQILSEHNLPSISQLSWWDWKIWILVFIGILLIMTVEWAYRHNKQLRGIEYYINRSKLPKITEEFADTSVGYALWFTGYLASNDWPLLKDRIQKLILVKPDLCNQQPFLGHITDIWKKNPKDAIDSIIRLSQEAHNSGTNVEWIEEKPNELIVISNPYADNAWTRIENFDLSKHSSEWDSVRIYKKHQPLLFSAILSEYKYLWEICNEPDWDKT